MFFMMGITDGRKDFDFTQTVICGLCRHYGRYQVFMTYTVLSLFFIPCLKWNKHYYVQMSCCGGLYELDPAIGRAIAKGAQLEIRPEHLTRVQSSYGYGNGYGSGNNSGYGSGMNGGNRYGNGSNSGYGYKHCRNCGFETTEDFDFCPKCGNRF